jgi:hypothetical protein
MYNFIGIGVALEAFTSSTVIVRAVADESAAQDIFDSPRAHLLIHHLAVFRAALHKIGYNLPFSVSLHAKADEFPPHCGLGSTSSAVLGLYHGINESLDRPFSHDQLRLLLADNFVEECTLGSDKLSRGFETTMTATGTHGGGIYVLSEKRSEGLPVLARNCSETALGDIRVLILGPSTNFVPTERGNGVEHGGRVGSTVRRGGYQSIHL